VVASPEKRSETPQALIELQSLLQWCDFKIEKRTEADEKPTKVPYHPKNYKASSKKSSTWSTYEAVVRACRIANLFSGIGFFFNGQVYSGIDIDDCVDEHGNIAEWAWEIIRLLDSYTEYSTSGTGVHIVVKGLLQIKALDEDGIEYIKGWKNNPSVGNMPKGKLEIYSERRFFVVTGNHVSGTPTTINERQGQLLSILNTFFIEPKEEKQREFYKKSPKLPSNYQPAAIPQDDNELWQIMFREKNNGRTWERLYYGDTGDYMGDDGRIDESRADAALAAKLAFYTQHDASRVERMMWQTGLVRDKWTSHSTYLRRLTIDNAMKLDSNDYDPLYHKRETERLENKRFEEIRMNHQAKFAAQNGHVETDSDSGHQVEEELLETEAPKEEPKAKSKFEQTKEDVNKAIKSKDVEAIYSLADQIIMLSTQEQANIKAIIQQNKKELVKAGFSQQDFNDCLKAAERLQRELERAERGPIEPAPEYERKDTGMVYNSPMHGPVALSNFTAKITADTKVDDGVERTRFYELQAELYGRNFSFEVSAKDLDKCGWVDQELGARARVSAGNSTKAHLANAIKATSEPEEKDQYAHTGWRNIDGRSVFLHTGDCLSHVSQIGREKINNMTQISLFDKSALQAVLERERERISHVSHVSQENIQASVRLTGALSNYTLTCERSNMQQAIRASLGFMNLASDTITVPLYSALWRAVLGNVNFGVHLAGQTGWGKSELCALIQQHFGASMHAKNLPGSWESTVNSLEMLLFQAKDTVVVVDDFKPKGSKADQDRLHANADRVFRQIGNGQGRGRLDSNLGQRAERRPRCLLLSTGEDIPRGQSLKSRGIVLIMNERVTVGEASKRLLEAQKDARNGLYAQAMAGYIEWLASRIEAIQSQLADIVAEEREKLCIDGHARSSDNTANLLLGMKCFLQYAYEIGAITAEEARTYLLRCKNALIRIAEEASREDREEKQSEQWKNLIVSALINKSAYLAGPDGEYPGLEYGWEQSVRIVERDGIPENEETFRANGKQIGWIDGDDVYLSPRAAYEVARALGPSDLVTVESTLRKFLHQDGLLASTDLDKKRPALTVRRRLQKSQKDVLHIRKHTLFPSDPHVDSDDSHDSSDSELSKTASEDAPEVSHVDDEKASESDGKVDSDTTQVPNEDMRAIPQEYRDLLVRYQKKVFSIQATTVFWCALDSGHRNTMFGKNEHIVYTKSLLRSGELNKVKAAIEAMQRTLGEYQEDKRGA
jgi:primase-polymerase (primpol)-like protein/PIN domain nuclease of toxin-antitoxin system